MSLPLQHGGDIDHMFTASATSADQAPTVGVNGLIPTSECFVILTMSHARYRADTGTMTATGLPAMYDGLSLSTLL